MRHEKELIIESGIEKDYQARRTHGQGGSNTVKGARKGTDAKIVKCQREKELKGRSTLGRISIGGVGKKGGWGWGGGGALFQRDSG